MLAGMPCPCSGFVSKISYVICATVWGLRWCNLFSQDSPSWNHNPDLITLRLNAEIPKSGSRLVTLGIS